MNGFAMDPMGRGFTAILICEPLYVERGFGEPTMASSSFSGILMTTTAPLCAFACAMALMRRSRTSRIFSVSAASIVRSHGPHARLKVFNSNRLGEGSIRERKKGLDEAI